MRYATFGRYEVPLLEDRSNDVVRTAFTEMEQHLVIPHISLRIGDSGQVITHNSLNAVTWTARNAENQDSDFLAVDSTAGLTGQLSLPGSAIPLPATGLWSMSCFVVFDPHATGYREVTTFHRAGPRWQSGVFPTGSATALWRTRVPTVTAGSGTYLSLSKTGFFAQEGDVIEMFVRQTSGGNLDILGGHDNTILDLTGIGTI